MHLSESTDSNGSISTDPTLSVLTTPSPHPFSLQQHKTKAEEEIYRCYHGDTGKHFSTDVSDPQHLRSKGCVSGDPEDADVHPPPNLFENKVLEECHSDRLTDLK